MVWGTTHSANYPIRAWARSSGAKTLNPTGAPEHVFLAWTNYWIFIRLKVFLGFFFETETALVEGRLLNQGYVKKDISDSFAGTVNELNLDQI